MILKFYAAEDDLVSVNRLSSVSVVKRKYHKMESGF